MSDFIEIELTRDVLKKLGYKTLVLALCDKKQNEHEFVSGVEVYRIRLITRFLPL